MKINKFKILNGYIFSILIWIGCNTPEPVRLMDESDDAKLIDMKTVNIESDSLLVSSGVDTTGTLGWGNQKYFGRMIFSSIHNGLMDSSSKNFVQAEAIFFDSSRAIQHSGHIIAYPSYDVGSLAINSDTMNKIERKIIIQTVMSDSIIGYRYLLRKDYSFIPNLACWWSASGAGNINAFRMQFTTPPELHVTEILPYYLSFSEPLQFKWQCTNPVVNIVISREGMLQQRKWIPILHLRIRNVKGEITIPVKILGMLPKRYDRLMFTFSSESKLIKSAGSAGGYPNEVLVQAASIHNIILNVHH